MNETERVRLINGICINWGFSGNYDFFVEWFMKSFPKNNDPRYIKEWLERFESGTPHTRMDKIRFRIYLDMLEKEF